MEILRQCGIESAVQDAALPPSKVRYVIRARSVAGEELDRREATFTPGAQASLSPTSACMCPQNHLEPVLLAAVREHGLTDVLFQHELTSFVQDEEGVTALVVNRESGDEQQVRAAYLVGADGAHSTVRQMLGVRMRGDAELSHQVLIYFRADLDEWFRDRAPNMVLIEGPGGPGPLLSVNGTNEWLYAAHFDPIRDQRADDFTVERSTALVRIIVGVADLPVEVIGVAAWTANALVAEHYSVDRVFLAGDAAHETTPAGGFGMNTGIQDVHNLAWKLAGVLRGWAAPALLETYEAERLPVGETVVRQSFRNFSSMFLGGCQSVLAKAGAHVETAPPATSSAQTETAQQYLNEWGLILGTAYTSAAISPDGTLPPQMSDPVTDYVPTARPGHRAPHVWIEYRGQRHSTLDLLSGGFVLFTGQAGHAWLTAGREVANALRVPLVGYAVRAAGDPHNPGAEWKDVYGIDETGAVLVRPDGHVAWRSRTGVPEHATVLRTAVAKILGRDSARSMNCPERRSATTISAIRGAP
jgi:2-polyprenyl-6-methoxyphenol hydroxylase-like FAD-dependent oxidoreductase